MKNLQDFGASRAYTRGMGAMAFGGKSIMTIGQTGTGLICVRCKASILLKDAAKVAEEFTAQCPKCGHRHFYQIKDIKTIDLSRPR